MMRVKRRRYSELEFDRGAELSRMDPRNVAIAKAVLLDGQAQAAVARETGMFPQRVNQLIAKMCRDIEKANPVPKGWRADMVTLPVRLWPKVRKLERQARDALLITQPKKKRRRASNVKTPS